MPMAKTVGEMTPKGRRNLYIFLGSVVIIVLLLIVVGSCTGGSSDDKSVPATTMPSTTTTPAATSSAAPKTNSNQAATDAFTKLILDGYGAKSFSEILSQNPSLWGGRVSSVTVDGPVAHVRTTYSTAEKEAGERASKAGANFIRNAADGNAAKDQIKWVVIEDGQGTVISQSKV